MPYNISMLDWILKTFVKDYRNTKNETVRKRYGMVAALFGLFSNLIVALMKVIIGILMHMSSILADASNNLSDFGNNFISIFGIRISAKGADKEHPFGHQRMEYVISLVIGCVIIAFGCVLGYRGIEGLISFFQSISENGAPVKDTSLEGESGQVLFIVSLVILILSAFIKILQSLLYFALGKRIDSMELKTLGKDSINDVLSTLLVMVGLIITKLTGYNVDCFFTIAVSILVVISGILIIKEASTTLIGLKPDQELIDEMVLFIQKNKYVLGVHDLAMHTYGQSIYAVIHIEMDASKSFVEVHQQADIIEREVLGKFYVHLTVHLDPIAIDAETSFYRQLIEKAIAEKNYPFKIHDFQKIDAKNTVHLIFDLVLPKNMDSPEKREEIHKYLAQSVNQRRGKEVYLNISYDCEDSDFLLGTETLEK